MGTEKRNYDEAMERLETILEQLDKNLDEAVLRAARAYSTLRRAAEACHRLLPPDVKYKVSWDTLFVDTDRLPLLERLADALGGKLARNDFDEGFNGERERKYFYTIRLGEFGNSIIMSKTVYPDRGGPTRTPTRSREDRVTIGRDIMLMTPEELRDFVMTRRRAREITPKRKPKRATVKGLASAWSIPESVVEAVAKKKDT